MLGLLVLDSAMMLVGMWLAALFRFGTPSPQVMFDQPYEVFYPQLFPWLLATWLAVFYFNHLYDTDYLFWGTGELTRVGNSITYGEVFLVLGSFAAHLNGISRAWMLLSWGLAFALVCAGRLSFRQLVAYLRRKGKLSSRALIAGCNEEAEILLARAEKPNSGLDPIGFVCGRQEVSRSIGCLPQLGGIEDLPGIVTENRIESVLIASSDFSHKEITKMVQSLRGLHIDVHISAGLFEVLTARVLVREVGGVPMVTVRRVSLTRGKLLAKRALDLCVGMLGMLMLLPVWLLLALAIKITSEGPIVYSQRRVGRDAKPFNIYKFRSMVADADKRVEELAKDQPQDVLFKLRRDPRVTAVGRWLRRYSIDEVPQLLNVIRGDMSLVGPRPSLPREVGQYEDWHFRRFEVMPGMTGLWQVSGRSDLSFDEAVRLDIYYLENWSPLLDLSILARTIPVVFFPKGAY